MCWMVISIPQYFDDTKWFSMFYFSLVSAFQPMLAFCNYSTVCHVLWVEVHLVT